MDDQKIIALFFERSEQAIINLSQKYGALCHHIAGNILSSPDDIEECVSDSYLALWNSIPPERPDSLRAYLLNILRNIAYDRVDYRTADKRDSRLQVCLHELEGCLPDPHTTDVTLESSVIRDTINDYLKTLPAKDRFLFIRRYYYLDTCREIGKMTGISESSVSTRLLRLRNKLKMRLLKEGIYV